MRKTKLFRVAFFRLIRFFRNIRTIIYGYPNDYHQAQYIDTNWTNNMQHAAAMVVKRTT